MPGLALLAAPLEAAGQEGLLESLHRALSQFVVNAAPTDQPGGAAMSEGEAAALQGACATLPALTRAAAQGRAAPEEDVGALSELLSRLARLQVHHIVFASQK